VSQPPGVNHRILVLDLSEERSRTVGVFVASSASASFGDRSSQSEFVSNWGPPCRRHWKDRRRPLSRPPIGSRYAT